jgi:hypothetical protein
MIQHDAGNRAGRLPCLVIRLRGRDVANKRPIKQIAHRDTLRFWFAAHYASPPDLAVSFEAVLDAGPCFGRSESLRREAHAMSRRRIIPAGLAALDWEQTMHGAEWRS